MPASIIEDLPNEILVDGIFMKLSLANRLNQQRTCRRWKTLMPLNDKDLKVVPLVEEMLQLWHRDDEEEVGQLQQFSVSACSFLDYD